MALIHFVSIMAEMDMFLIDHRYFMTQIMLFW